MPHPDPAIIALGIRQPWIELILRGVKTIEVRSQGTQVRGPIYLYASVLPAANEAATVIAEEHEIDLPSLPRGQVVGVAELWKVTASEPDDAAAACVPASWLEQTHSWHLRNVERFAIPLPILHRPFGVWFYPWRRKA